MDRRTLLRRGLAGGALLAAAGVGVARWPAASAYRPRRALSALDDHAFGVLAAIAARTVAVEGADPVEIAHGVDETLAYGPLEVQADMRNLLRLVESPLAGLLLDGRPRSFTALPGDAQDAVLYAWRDSRLVLRRSGYVALRKLTLASYYARPACWAAVGYPGPPEVAT